MRTLLFSMTGFSRSQVDRPWGSLTAEVSSVNHRYQEVSVRSPRDLAGFEPLIQAMVRKEFQRGKVLVRVEVNWHSQYRAVEINPEVLKNYFTQVTRIRRELDLPGESPLEQLLPLPGVTERSLAESESIREQLEEALKELISTALEDWKTMRLREGCDLHDEVMTHLREFEDIVTQIEERWPESRDQAIEALRERIGTLMERLPGERTEIEESRFAQEVSVLADRWDVSEEIARIHSHLDKFRSISESKGAVGRKLDFLIQELNREVNTTGSKVQAAQIRWLILEAKSSLERIREQIRKVE